MTAWLPLLPVVLIAVSGVWVNRDATRLERDHSPVVLRSSFIKLDSPQDWTIACVLGWIIFFPLYVRGRNREI
jgi:hypothetical protein